MMTGEHSQRSNSSSDSDSDSSDEIHSSLHPSGSAAAMGGRRPNEPEWMSKFSMKGSPKKQVSISGCGSGNTVSLAIKGREAPNTVNIGASSSSFNNKQRSGQSSASPTRDHKGIGTSSFVVRGNAIPSTPSWMKKLRKTDESQKAGAPALPLVPSLSTSKSANTQSVTTTTTSASSSTKGIQPWKSVSLNGSNHSIGSFASVGSSIPESPQWMNRFKKPGMTAKNTTPAPNLQHDSDSDSDETDDDQSVMSVRNKSACSWIGKFQQLKRTNSSKNFASTSPMKQENPKIVGGVGQGGEARDGAEPEWMKRFREIGMSMHGSETPRKTKTKIGVIPQREKNDGTMILQKHQSGKTFTLGRANSLSQLDTSGLGPGKPLLDPGRQLLSTLPLPKPSEAKGPWSGISSAPASPIGRGQMISQSRAYPLSPLVPPLTVQPRRGSLTRGEGHDSFSSSTTASLALIESPKKNKVADHPSATSPSKPNWVKKVKEVSRISKNDDKPDWMVRLAEKRMGLEPEPVYDKGTPPWKRKARLKAEANKKLVEEHMKRENMEEEEELSGSDDYDNEENVPEWILQFKKMHLSKARVLTAQGKASSKVTLLRKGSTSMIGRDSDDSHNYHPHHSFANSLLDLPQGSRHSVSSAQHQSNPEKEEDLKKLNESSLLSVDGNGSESGDEDSEESPLVPTPGDYSNSSSQSIQETESVDKEEPGQKSAQETRKIAPIPTTSSNETANVYMKPTIAFGEVASAFSSAPTIQVMEDGKVSNAAADSGETKDNKLGNTKNLFLQQVEIDSSAPVNVMGMWGSTVKSKKPGNSTLMSFRSIQNQQEKVLERISKEIEIQNQHQPVAKEDSDDASLDDNAAAAMFGFAGEASKDTKSHSSTGFDNSAAALFGFGFGAERAQGSQQLASVGLSGSTDGAFGLGDESVTRRTSTTIAKEETISDDSKKKPESPGPPLQAPTMQSQNAPPCVPFSRGTIMADDSSSSSASCSDSTKQNAVLKSPAWTGISTPRADGTTPKSFLDDSSSSSNSSEDDIKNEVAVAAHPIERNDSSQSDSRDKLDTEADDPRDFSSSGDEAKMISASAPTPEPQHGVDKMKSFLDSSSSSEEDGPIPKRSVEAPSVESRVPKLNEANNKQSGYSDSTSSSPPNDIEPSLATRRLATTMATVPQHEPTNKGKAFLDSSSSDEKEGEAKQTPVVAKAKALRPTRLSKPSMSTTPQKTFLYDSSKSSSSSDRDEPKDTTKSFMLPSAPAHPAKVDGKKGGEISEATSTSSDKLKLEVDKSSKGDKKKTAKDSDASSKSITKKNKLIDIKAKSNTTKDKKGIKGKEAGREKMSEENSFGRIEDKKRDKNSGKYADGRKRSRSKSRDRIRSSRGRTKDSRNQKGKDSKSKKKGNDDIYGADDFFGDDCDGDFFGKSKKKSMGSVGKDSASRSSKKRNKSKKMEFEAAGQIDPFAPDSDPFSQFLGGKKKSGSGSTYGSSAKPKSSKKLVISKTNARDLHKKRIGLMSDPFGDDDSFGPRDDFDDDFSAVDEFGDFCLEDDVDDDSVLPLKALRNSPKTEAVFNKKNRPKSRDKKTMKASNGGGSKSGGASTKSKSSKSISRKKIGKAEKSSQKR